MKLLTTIGISKRKVKNFPENTKDRRKTEANLSKILTDQSFDFGDLLVQLFDFLRRQERVVGLELRDLGTDDRGVGQGLLRRQRLREE